HIRRSHVDEKADHRSSRLSRREFGKQVALVTGAAVVPSPRVSGRVAAAAAGEHAGHAPFNQSDPALEKLSADGRVRFESMWQNVLRKHGDRLSDEQKVRMRKIIANNVVMLEAIYAVPVRNGDTPATTLLLVD